MNRDQRQSELPEDEMWLRWQAHITSQYDSVFYRGNRLVRRISEAGHRLIEQPFARDDRFGYVLEVGGGGYQHLPHVHHAFDRYIVSDLDHRMLERALAAQNARPDVTAAVLDARSLPYTDNSLDRVISVYNLEHLPDPHLVLKEWARVVKPGGILSIAIPTEGGLAWMLGRHMSTRRTFRRLGFDYDYVVAREHVNTCARLVAFIRHYFPDRQDRWYPTGLPTPHFNLVFATTIRIHKAGDPAMRVSGMARGTHG